MIGLSNPTNIITVYLEKLGASNFEIGLVPSISYLGLMGLQVFGAYFTSTLKKLRSVMMVWCICLSVPWLGAAIIALYTSPGETSNMYVFMGFYLLFWIGLGPMIPAWNTFMGKIFDPKKLGMALGIIFSIHVLFGGIGAYAASRIIKQDFGFEFTYFLLFFGSFLCIATPNFFILLVRGEPEYVEKKRVGIVKYFSRLSEVVKQDRNFLKYLIARLLSFVSPLLIYFYAVHGTSEHGLSAAEAALLATAALFTQAPACLVMGWISDKLSAKTAIAIGYAALLAALVSVLLAETIWGFYVASAFIGIYFATEIVGHNAFILNMYKESKRTDMLGITALAVTPFAVGLPLIGGRLIDLYSFDAVMPFIGIPIILGLVVLVFGVKTVSPGAETQ